MKKKIGTWLLFSLLTGALGGLIGVAFYKSVALATHFRETYDWLLWLLPVAGVLIALMYRLTGMEGVGTNAILDSVHTGRPVPLALVPTIFASTVLTHLCGGSAGREGAALQIGGGVASGVARLFRLDAKSTRVATVCGMSALFSALFGTPLAATLFAMEVASVGLMPNACLAPGLISALTSFGVTSLFSVPPTRFAVAMPALTLALTWRVALLGALCAVVSVLFCVALRQAERWAERRLPNALLRAATGGALLIGLALLLGTRDFNGAGVAGIKAALEDGVARPDAFFWKIVFTAVTIACGFRGGEVVPSFFIGATLGCAVGPLLGLPAGFAAALGLVAVFCGAVNCPVASIALSVELFGSNELVCFALVCAVSYLLSGHFGLYSSQRLVSGAFSTESFD